MEPRCGQGASRERRAAAECDERRPLVLPGPSSTRRPASRRSLARRAGARPSRPLRVVPRVRAPNRLARRQLLAERPCERRAQSARRPCGRGRGRSVEPDRRGATGLADLGVDRRPACAGPFVRLDQWRAVRLCARRVRRPGCRAAGFLGARPGPAARPEQRRAARHPARAHRDRAGARRVLHRVRSCLGLCGLRFRGGRILHLGGCRERRAGEEERRDSEARGEPWLPGWPRSHRPRR